jgi:ankyrin repeat protein
MPAPRARAAERARITPQLVTSFDQRLLAAVCETDGASAVAILDSGVGEAVLNCLSPADAYTPLMLAIQQRCRPAILLLLQDERVKINHVATNGQTALSIAAAGKDTTDVELLLARNAIPYKATEDMVPPIFMAAQLGNVDCASLLLTARAHIDDREPESNVGVARTSLHIASCNGHLRVIHVLLGADADVCVRTSREGATALFYACEQGHTDCVLVLLEAARQRLPDGASRRLHVDAGKLSGQTPLYIAAKNGHIACVQRLLDERANVDLPRTHDRMSPLIMAAHGGHTDVVQALLAGSADVAAATTRTVRTESGVTRAGLTALQAASMNGHAACARLISEAEEDRIDEEATAAWEEVEAAEEAEAEEEAAAVLDSEVNRRAEGLVSAAQQGDLEAVNTLLASGVDPNTPQKVAGILGGLDDYYALSVACTCQHAAVVRALLRHRATPDTLAAMGSPLHIASAVAWPLGVTLLLHARASPDGPGEGEKSTPLCYCLIQSGRTQQISRTHLTTAERTARVELCVRLLVAAGTDVHRRSDDGSSARQMALKQRLTGCAQVLTRARAESDAVALCVLKGAALGLLGDGGAQASCVDELRAAKQLLVRPPEMSPSERGRWLVELQAHVAAAAGLSQRGPTAPPRSSQTHIAPRRRPAVGSASSSSTESTEGDASGGGGDEHIDHLLTHVRVVLTGLASSPHLNGRLGSACAYHSDSGRLEVQLDAEGGDPMGRERASWIRVRPANLLAAVEGAQAARAPEEEAAALGVRGSTEPSRLRAEGVPGAQASEVVGPAAANGAAAQGGPPPTLAPSSVAAAAAEADDALTAAVQAHDLEALRSAITQYQVHASAEALQAARRARDTLKDRDAKKRAAQRRRAANCATAAMGVATARSNTETVGEGLSEEVVAVAAEAVDAEVVATEEAPAAVTEVAVAAAEAAVAAAAAPARPAPAAPNTTEPPDEFVCPITQELMGDPVLASDGHAYERSAIERWFETRLTSPKTGNTLETAGLIPNHPLRCLIVDWREANGI